MKVPVNVQAAAMLELRKRRTAKRSELHDESGNVKSLKKYCELVTPNWTWDWPHLMYVDDVLDQVTAGKIKRVIIEMPTRIGKTEKVNVRYPAQRLELDPTTSVLLTGYNEKFANRLSRKIYRIAKERIPMSNRTAVGDWETAEGGGVRAAGVGVGIAGLPANLILIDDPVKNREDAFSEAHRDRVWDWYTEDVYTRLEPDGAIIITMARRHEDDLVGRILASEDADQWTVVRLPALAEEDDPLGRPLGAALCPDRFDEAAYARMRKVIGEVSFSGLQQQRPTPASGLIFQIDDIRYYTTVNHPIKNSDGTMVTTLPGRMEEEFQSWDMSYKEKSDSDFVSGQVWGIRGADAYFLDRKSDRWAFTQSLREFRSMNAAHPRALLKLVEDKANGPAIISHLRSEIGGIRAVTPEGDKVERAYSITPLFEGGNVWFPHPQICPWIKKVIHQMIQFPFGTNDDDVDAMVQGLRHVRKKLERAARMKKKAKQHRGTASLQLMRM